MLTLTFAGDESGDVSFAFDKGASRYFVVAVIATPVPDQLRQLLADLRREGKMPPQFEFRFNSLSTRLRGKTLLMLAQAPFDSWAIIIDKTSVSDAFKVMRGSEFYL